MFRSTLCPLILGLSLLLGLNLAAQADTLHVPADQPSIQAAITAAAPGDTILVAAGVYSESLDWENKDLILQGAGAGQSILDPSGGPGGRCVFMAGLSAASRLEGFTLQNGNELNDFGGGIYNGPSSNPTVANCTFSDNWATYGGGIYNGPSSNPTVTNCTFSNNLVIFSGLGGGIYNDSYTSPTMTDCTFSNNFADNAGGIYNGTFSSSTVTNCTFSGNSGSFGGGIYNDSFTSSTVTNCTFSGNRGDLGGGIFSFRNSLTVTNCTFSGNSASLYGGGMSNGESNATITNCTFSGNSASRNGGGIDNDAQSSATVTNCILWGNSAPSGGGIDNGTFSSATVTNSDLQDLSNPAPDASGNFAADPRFVRNPRANGPDDLGDLHLQFGSPAIDSGLDSAVTVPPFPADSAGQPLDLDGNPRISRAHVDMGAYEYQNQAPIANPQSLSLNQDTSLGITLTGSDPENDALTFAIVTGPAHGSLSGTAPNLTYTPNPGYVGTDRFTFQVQDVFGALSNLAAVSLTVKDTTPPVITLNGSNPMTVNQGGMFTDPGATAVDNVDGPVPVSVSGNVNTAVVGTYTLTYSASDKAGNTAVKTRTVNVVASPIQVKLTSLGEFSQYVGVIVTLQNSGAAPASNVRITSASLMGVNALLIAPNTWFDLAGGKSAQVGLLFYPLQKGQQGTLSIRGSYSGGTFSLNQAVIIP